MGEQHTFASLAWAAKGKITKRERFLNEMDQAIPWQRFLSLIEPHYPKAGNGRPPMGLEKMLRIYFLQQWFNLSDPGAEEALYDSESMRRFARIELAEDAIPDESTILLFRHLLERHELTRALFQETVALLEEKNLFVKTGTIVDATIIEASGSTKNKAETRDPEMRQTQKSGKWYFGMKVHFGTDKRGLVHSLGVTHAAVADINELGPLLHGEEKELYGDSAYWSKAYWEQCLDQGIRYRVNRRPTRAGPLSDTWRRINRSRSQVRARCEHCLGVVKHRWGFRRVRYRGLAKNEARACTMFALANIYSVRRRLTKKRV